MVNRVYMIGRLTRDPEAYDTSSGGKLCSMRLVTNEFRKSPEGERIEEPQFHSVVAFGRLGEICAGYLRKGRLVFIDGRLRTREWDGKDGIKRYTTEIVADNMQMLSPKPAGEGDATEETEGEPVERVAAGAGA